MDPKSHIECPVSQSDKFWQQDGKECPGDFSRLYRSQCAGCSEDLSDAEIVIWIFGNLYHESCLKCTVCDRPSLIGDRVYLRDGNKLVCEEDNAKLQGQDPGKNFFSWLAEVLSPNFIPPNIELTPDVIRNGEVCLPKYSTRPRHNQKRGDLSAKYGTRRRHNQKQGDLSAKYGTRRRHNQKQGDLSAKYGTRRRHNQKRGDLSAPSTQE